MYNFNEMLELNVGLLIFSIMINILLLMGALTSDGKNKPFMRYFILLMISNVFMLIGEVHIWLADGSPESEFLMITGLVLSFACGYLTMIFFAYCLISFVQKKMKVSWKFAHFIAASCIIFAVLNLLSINNGTLFYIDDTGIFKYTELYTIVNLFDVVIIFLQIFIVIKYREALKKRGTFLMLSFSVLPLATTPLQLFWDTTPKCLAITLSIIALYTLFQVELTREMAEQKKELAEKERKLAEGRISTMISQIQPHFIYNTLGTIEQLCLDRPEMAAELVHDFSLYLRGNFSQLDNTTLIGLSQELAHVRHYANIEKVRFPDMTIVYDLNSGDFLLPALTIQPLVENAIKHGLMKLEHGGKVTVHTYETDTHYCVSVDDDGAGFETAAIQEDSRHIGIRNIRGRLEAMCNGTLTIESVPGKGTKALIKIPKQGK